MVYKSEQECIKMFIDEASKYSTLNISKEFIDYLKEQGFFTKPAAIKHHGN